MLNQHHITYLESLLARHTDELGFLPSQAIQEYNTRGQILLAEENNEPAGYLIFFHGRNQKPPRFEPATVRIHQIVIQNDARRIYHATQLIHQLQRIVRHPPFTHLKCWCASDLEANRFWQAIGFHFTGHRIGGRRRNRIHNQWTMPIHPLPPTRRPTNNNHPRSVDPRYKPRPLNA